MLWENTSMIVGVFEKTQELDSQNKLHQGSHFFQLQGGVFETCSTPTLKGLQMWFHCDKGVDGGCFHEGVPEFTNNSMILLSFMLLKGSSQCLKEQISVRQVLMGSSFKMTKSFGGDFKIFLRLAWCLISKSSAPREKQRSCGWA